MNKQKQILSFCWLRCSEAEPLMVRCTSKARRVVFSGYFVFSADVFGSPATLPFVQKFSQQVFRFCLLLRYQQANCFFCSGNCRGDRRRKGREQKTARSKGFFLFGQLAIFHWALLFRAQAKKEEEALITRLVTVYFFSTCQLFFPV